MKKIVIVCTITLLLLCMTVSVAAQSTTYAAFNDLKYGAQAVTPDIMLMGDLLGQIDEFTVTEEEKSYIRYKFSGQNFLEYTKALVVEPEYEYDPATRTLTFVIMDDYYRATNGKYVIWTPETLTVGDKKAQFVQADDLGEEYYRAVVEDVHLSSSVTVTIEYGADFLLTANTLNSFVNFAYDKAVQLDQQKATFEVDSRLYQEALKAYEANRLAWETYNSEMDVYKDHQDKIALYTDYVAYQTYLDKVAVYEREHAAYLANQREWEEYRENCLKYQDYLDYKAVYPGLYSTYSSQMSLAQEQLALLALMEKKDPAVGISFMDMMIDNRIGQAIADNYDALVLIKKSAVNAVVEATPELSNFCRGYKSLRTDQERYSYYISEYSDLVKNLKKLYTNIKVLYEVDIIYNRLLQEHPDNISSMVRMMGALYVYNTVFDDKQTMNLNTVVDTRGRQKASALVDPSLRPAADKNNATPIAAWPIEPTNPESYEVTKKPVAPTETLLDATYPTYPTFIKVKSASELPATMQDPGYMPEPTYPGPQLSHPGSAPTLVWDSYTQALHTAYTEGRLEQRSEYTQDQDVHLNVSANYSFSLDVGVSYCYVNFYNSDDAKTYLGTVSVVEGEAATYPEIFEKPTKKETDGYSYAFSGWVDRDGNAVDLSCVTQSMDVYADYAVTHKEYTVTWVLPHTVVEQKWKYGEIPLYTGSTHKPADAQYTYTFISWDKEPVAVTKDAVYTAQYSQTYNRYSVTFVMGDAASEVKEYNYGWDLKNAVPLAVPVKQSTPQYSYTFTGWRDQDGNFYTEAAQFPLLTKNMEFVAEFEPSINSYTVTWVVEGESISGVWKYGELPVFNQDPEVIPTKASTAAHHFEFIGWDVEIIPVTADATYTAQFLPKIRSYRIDFEVDGKIETVILEYGVMPEHAEPQKESDVQYHYSFAGWDHALQVVEGDAVYRACFSQTLRKYPVKFVVEGEEVILECDYGSKPVYPHETPAKPETSRLYYVFKGWNTDIVAVDGSEQTYTAVFEEILYAPAQNGESGELTVREEGVYEVTLEGNQVNLFEVFEKAGKAQAQKILVHFGRAVLEISKEQIDAFYLSENSVGTVSLIGATHEGNASYQLSLFDKQGTAISYLVSEIVVKIPYECVNTADVFMLKQDGTLSKIDAEYKDGFMSFSTIDQGTFVIKDKFTLTAAPTQNGVFDLVSNAYQGDVITFTPDPDEGYHLDQVLVECNGEQIEFELTDGTYSFVMPKGNVTVTTTFKVVEGGSGGEVVVGVITALLIVAIGIVIVVVLSKKKNAKV